MSSVLKSSSSKNKSMMRSEENSNQESEKHLKDWKLPNIPNHKIYRQGLLGTFRSPKDYEIHTVEETIPLGATTSGVTSLIRGLRLHTGRGKYSYLHLGSIQVGVKPIRSLGPDKSIVLCLRDARCLSFDDSLLAAVESDLCDGPFYFNYFPNFCVSLDDPHITDVLTLNIKANGFNLKEKSLPMILIFRVSYKLLSSAFSTKYIGPISGRGETNVIKGNSGNILKVLKWDEIQFPEHWGAVQTEKKA
ncbi:hypothetical protein Sjap_007415 [Stephania japonica]|uniref:Movement protein n=1 Tax=Stephania japonica TaxID=461633 RepID=A0AAP0JMJ7_9MAGN